MHMQKLHNNKKITLKYLLLYYNKIAAKRQLCVPFYHEREKERDVPTSIETSVFIVKVYGEANMLNNIVINNKLLSYIEKFVACLPACHAMVIVYAEKLSLMLKHWANNKQHNMLLYPIVRRRRGINENI